MKQYAPAVKRGIKKVSGKMRQMRVEGSGTLDADGLRAQWDRYQQLPLAERAVWVSSRLRTEDKVAIEGEMIKFEEEMEKRFAV